MLFQKSLNRGDALADLRLLRHLHRTIPVSRILIAETSEAFREIIRDSQTSDYFVEEICKSTQIGVHPCTGGNLLEIQKRTPPLS